MVHMVRERIVETSTRLNRGMVLMQPWARLVAEGVLPVLIRPTHTNIRGRVAVVARGWDSRAVVDGIFSEREGFPEPAILGSVVIVDCVRVPVRKTYSILTKQFGTELTKFYPRHFVPKQSPVYFWLLGRSRVNESAKQINPHRARIWIRL
jgi:hypothetical protein